MQHYLAPSKKVEVEVEVVEVEVEVEFLTYPGVCFPMSFRFPIPSSLILSICKIVFALP